LIISPRRGEAVTNPDGTPTRRFAEYLESSATQVSETTAASEVDPASINLSGGARAALDRRISAIEAMIGIFPAGGSQSSGNGRRSGQGSADDRLAALEAAIPAMFFRLQQQIDELKVTQ
jgi:hypothetical protein